MKLFVKKLFDDAKLPTKTNPSDSGFDVYVRDFKKLYVHSGSDGERCFDKPEQIATRVENIKGIDCLKLQYLERVLIGTGLSMTIGEGYEIQVRSRSGFALNNGLFVLNSPGTIDYLYKNEIGIIICNTSRQSQYIKLGDKIAQLVPQKIELIEIESINNLPGEDRGGGFGHSGTR